MAENDGQGKGNDVPPPLPDPTNFMSPTDAEAAVEAAWGTTALNEMFSAPHRYLLYSDGGLEDGMKQAAKRIDGKCRLFLINIQDYDDDQTAFGSFALNRDFWANNGVQELINTHCVFFQTTSLDRDASYYMQHFNVTRLPYVALLDPEKRKVLWKLEGWMLNLTDKDISNGIVDALSKLDGRKISADSISSSRGSFTIPPQIDVPNELGFQRAVMRRMSSADCIDATEFFELQQALEASQKATEQAGIERAVLKRKASTDLGLDGAVVERMTSIESMTEEEYQQFQAALLASKKTKTDPNER